MKAPPEYIIRVEFAERDSAKAAGCRWRPEIKRWVFASYRPGDKAVRKRGIHRYAPLTPQLGVLGNLLQERPMQILLGAAEALVLGNEPRDAEIRTQLVASPMKSVSARPSKRA